jgi:hypothetical protein
LHRLADGAIAECGISTPIGHALSRPMAVEREATHRAIALSELVDTPVLIVHVSGREAIEQIRWAQGRGLSVYGETCPQYLFLTEDSLEGGFEAAGCICSPPPRDEINRQAVWDGLENGTFDIVSSDHAPFLRAGPSGKKIAGATAPFNKVPNGIPGIETRLPLLFSGGVVTGRIEPQTFVALTSTTPAPTVRALSAQGDDRRRQRRRSRHLGTRAGENDYQCHAASRGRLHTLRRHCGDRVAGVDAVARRGRLGRRKWRRTRLDTAGPRRIPALCAAGAGASASPARRKTALGCMRSAARVTGAHNTPFETA